MLVSSCAAMVVAFTSKICEMPLPTSLHMFCSVMHRAYIDEIDVVLDDSNMASTWAVDRELFDISLFPVASFGCLWSAFGFPWADFGLLLTPSGARGLQVGILWVPLAPFGMTLSSPWPAFGIPLAVLEHMEPG